MIIIIIIDNVLICCAIYILILSIDLCRIFVTHLFSCLDFHNLCIIIKNTGELQCINHKLGQIIDILTKFLCCNKGKGQINNDGHADKINNLQKT